MQHILIHGLKKHGPYWFGGYFGQQEYKNYPFPYKKVNGREIFGWKPGSKITTKNKEGHAIVVVGAEKAEKGELIYFIDPSDESDPLNHSAQRIYVISYRTFTANCVDTYGLISTGAQSAFKFGVFNPNCGIKS